MDAMKILKIHNFSIFMFELNKIIKKKVRVKAIM